MYSVWTYPWTLYQSGLPAALGDLADRGADAVNLASRYHSIRALQPRFPDQLFVEYPSGCYFDPDPERFADTPIDPLPNDVEGADDAVAETVAAAADCGLDVNAWTVCFHGTRLATANPSFRIQSAFGDAHDHAFCPSHPEVREFYAALAGALADRGVAEIQLEALRYQSAFHDHGARSGHDKGQLGLSPAGRTLLSQCFCDACRSAARERGVDLDAAAARVRGLLAPVLRDPARGPAPVADLVAEVPVLRDLFAFRSDVLADLVSAMADRATGARLSCYVDGTGHDRWATGLCLADVDDALDRFLALCYVSTPADAREAVRALRARVDSPVDAGVTLDPSVVDDRDQFLALVAALEDEGAGQVAVYNHGFTTETHLEWLDAAFD